MTGRKAMPEEERERMKGSQTDNRTFFRKAASSRISIADIFSDLFKPHTRAEGEAIFLAGISGNIPGQLEMLQEWRKPWLFVRVLAAFALLLLLLFLIDMQGYGIFVTVPFILFSAMAIPFCTLLFYMEMNIPKNIPLYEVVGMFLIGGVISLLFTGIFNEVAKDAPSQWAMLTEEPAKLLALMIFLRKPDRRYILNGILIGGAIGAGFASIESVGYFLASDDSLQTALTRALLSPGGHVLWAALYGGALALVKEDRPLKLEHLADLRFLKYLGAAMLLHFLWNLDFSIVSIPVFVDVKFLLLIAAGWALMLQEIGQGVRQVMALSASGWMKRAAGRPKPVLHCMKGAFGGSTLPLEPGTLVLGRDSRSCNLVFPTQETAISRRHCVLTFDGRDVWLQDEGSSCGTYLADGRRLAPGERVRLSGGARFSLAGTDNVFELGEEGEGSL